LLGANVAGENDGWSVNLGALGVGNDQNLHVVENPARWGIFKKNNAVGENSFKMVILQSEVLPKPLIVGRSPSKEVAPSEMAGSLIVLMNPAIISITSSTTRGTCHFILQFK